MLKSSWEPGVVRRCWDIYLFLSVPSQEGFWVRFPHTHVPPRGLDTSHALIIRGDLSRSGTIGTPDHMRQPSRDHVLVRVVPHRIDRGIKILIPEVATKVWLANTSGWVDA